MNVYLAAQLLFKPKTSATALCCLLCKSIQSDGSTLSRDSDPLNACGVQDSSHGMELAFSNRRIEASRVILSNRYIFPQTIL